MPAVVIALAILIAASVIVSVAWRLLSRRYAIPCPSWFTWALENPYMESVAGSAAIIKRAGVQSGMRILDAGCGPGRLTLPLARKVGPRGKVIALDMQTSMLSKLTGRLEGSGLTNVEKVHAPLGSGALGKEQIDRAFLVTVLGEIPDKEKALKEVYDVLVPGGCVSVTEILPDPHYQTRRAVQRLALGIGFIPQLVFKNYRAYTINLTKPAPGSASHNEEH